MSARVITLREEDPAIVDHAVDLAVEGAGQLTDDTIQQFNALIRAAVPDSRTAGQLQDAGNDMFTAVLDRTTRLGFYMGCTFASHGASGDRRWLAEALRLSGEDVTVEVRQAEG